MATLPFLFQGDSPPFPTASDFIRMQLLVLRVLVAKEQFANTKNSTLLRNFSDKEMV